MKSSQEAQHEIKVGIWLQRLCRTEEWADELMMLYLDRAVYTCQRTLYGSPTQGGSRGKKRKDEPTDCNAYSTAAADEHKFVIIDYCRGAIKGTSDGDADKRNCGISGAPYGCVPPVDAEESRTLRIRYTTKRFIRRIRNSFSDNRAVHLSSGRHTRNSFKSKRTRVFMSGIRC